MPTVNTATGPVDTSKLGFTLMHEHIYVLTEGLVQTFPHLWDREARIGPAAAQLAEAKAHGVDTMVDLTVLGLGRDVTLVREAALRSGMQVIVATGLYTYDEVPRHFEHRDVDYMADLFVHDIEQGIQGAGIKAAILKCATDEKGLTPGVEKVLRAVGRAHKRTGVPISTHTHAATERGLDQQRIFMEEGVDLSRVVIGHSGDTEDLSYLEKLIGAGSYIGMDRFGLHQMLPTEKRVAVIAKLCERGHADRIVLSHDTMCYIDWYPEEMRAALPDYHYLHIPDAVVPALRAAGVSENQIRAMTVDNPRSIFERQGAY
ncbi:MAG: phosphotriesterase [Chloroflexi bacterium]|nr:phosphotriesterase [Chloroflexota bacterium]